MAGVYDTELKQKPDGTWYRWLGEDEKGTRQQFRLGKDKAEAKRRLRLILALYETQTVAAKFYGGTWVPEQLKAAKQIAKGKVAQLPRLSLRINESDAVQQAADSYARRLAHLNRDGETFKPEKTADFEEALEAVEDAQKRNRLIKVRLVGTNPDRDPTGQTIAQALDAFMDFLTTESTLPDGSLKPWGKTQVTQVNSWRNYMAEAMETRNGKKVSLNLLNTDLADLTVAKAQQMVDATRKRPFTFDSKLTRRMSPKTANSINKKIRHFFDWLDLSDEWQWWEPPRFRKLNYRVAELTEEERHEQKLKRDNWRISDEEIKTLVEHATPAERVLILLGLNCAFGAGEIGSLRIPYIKLETAEIDGIRFKTGNDTRHHLWPETIEALEWELRNREELPKSEECKDIVFLSDEGIYPLWRKSRAGNYVNGVAKRWKSLMDRITKSDSHFRRFSFGKLRKTAAIRILELADAETASMLLAHGKLSEDRILSAYVNIPWQKLYQAQRAYGETVRPLLKTKRPPLEQPPKDYIGSKAKQLLEQYNAGRSVRQIARDLNISVMTVYRHLDRAGLRQCESDPPPSLD